MVWRRVECDTNGSPKGADYKDMALELDLGSE